MACLISFQKPVVPPGLAGSLKRRRISGNRMDVGRFPPPPTAAPPAGRRPRAPALGCARLGPKLAPTSVGSYGVPRGKPTIGHGKTRRNGLCIGHLVLWAVTSGLGRLETGFSNKCSPTGNGQLLRALATLVLQSSCSSRVQVMPAALWPWSQPLAVLSHTNSSAR